MDILELHLDLDGLFTDFDTGVQRASREGLRPKELPKSLMWKIIHSNKTFFRDLDQLPGSERLWAYIVSILPTERIKFLTGAPSSASFQQQKRDWVALKFGAQYECNVVHRRDKQKWSGPCKVLIDDTEGNIHDWVVKGGHGILHEGDFDKTIDELREYYEALKAA